MGVNYMLFIKLEKQYFNLFGDLDPFSLLDDNSAGRFAIGLWGKHEGYDYPVGLVICSETPDSLNIDWMMVASVFREQGFGAYMLKKLIKLAREFKKTKVMATFPYSPARDIICRGDKIFFKQFGFVNEDIFDGVSYLTLPEEHFEVDRKIGNKPRLNFLYKLENMINDFAELNEKEIESLDNKDYEQISLEELGKTKIMSVTDEKDSVDALADLEIREMVKIINESFDSKQDGIVILNQDEFDVSTVDLDVSCVIKKDGQTEGLLLISLAEDDSLVIRKFIVSDKLSRLSIAYMLKHSYSKMLEKYNDSCKICIRKDGENSQELINALNKKAVED